MGDDADEVWKEIPGFDGWYEISTYARVRSYRRTGTNSDRRAEPRLLKGQLGPLGYHYTTLHLNGEPVTNFLHTWVMLTFVGPRPAGMHIAHGNGIRNDNRLSNLRYATPKENYQDREAHGTWSRGSRNGNRKLTESDVVQIRTRAASGERRRVLAVEFGVAVSTIDQAINGHCWKHVA